MKNKDREDSERKLQQISQDATVLLSPIYISALFSPLVPLKILVSL